MEESSYRDRVSYMIDKFFVRWLIEMLPLNSSCKCNFVSNIY